MWRLTPPPSRPGYHFEYIGKNLELLLRFWAEEAMELETKIRAQDAWMRANSSDAMRI